MNSYKDLLMNDERFRLEDGLFYQKDFARHNAFEESYLQLRQKEGRVYSDEIVRMLPEFKGQQPLATEWKIRKKSTQRLTHYLTKRRPSHIIEIGCGNGWLIHSLQKHIAAAYCGIDINEPELQQAARVFGPSSASFIYGDILSGAMNALHADAIIVASAAQYFSPLNSFIDQLIALLTPNGEIHIIDTPFYAEAEIENAQKRSEQYFTDAGVNAEQRHYYHHHSWKSLQSFHYRIEYEPTGFLYQLKKQFIHDSPFPWIVIAKKDNHG